MRPRCSSLAPLLMACGLISGQVSVQNPSHGLVNPIRGPRHHVTGTVVNSVTGEPIRRALVRANGAETHTGFTGPDGRFELIDIPEGQVVLSAERPGFLDPRSSGSPVLSSPTNVVQVGPATKDVVLQLMPDAKIRGRVVDDSGETVENLSVMLFAREIVEGRKQWMPRGQASSDDTGAYSFEDLAPGFYAMRTVPYPLPAVSSSESVTTRSEVLATKYYPDAPDLDSVQPMELKPGEEQEIDFALSPVRSFTVSGTAVGFEHSPVAYCSDEYGQQIAAGTHVDSHTGKFKIVNVPRGLWVIHLQTNGPQGQFFTAEQPVEVTASDVTGLRIQPQSLAPIPVRVLNASEFHSQVQLELVPARANMRGTIQPYAKPGDPPGSLEFHDVGPGTYKLLARVYGNDGACVESARSGGTDLSRDDLMVTAGAPPAPVEITLRSDCAAISGSVRFPSDIQQTTGFVILVGDSSLRAPDPISVGADGKFSFKNVTPGAYRVYAFSDIAGLEFANPEVLRDLPSQEVNVTANEKSTVQLDLIARGK